MALRGGASAVALQAVPKICHHSTGIETRRRARRANGHAAGVLIKEILINIAKRAPSANI